MNARSAMKRLLPSGVYGAYIRFRTRQIQQQYALLSCAEAFERVYACGAWGGGSTDGTLNSGWGSTGQYASEYCAMIERLLGTLRVASVADLGCGNFKVGKAVARLAAEYIGVDIAPSMIDRNLRAYGGDRVRFVRADLTCDPLPAADAALVRQVLQHLSNSEIQAALKNILSSYAVVFITEHVYTGPDGVPNLDIPHGPGTRVPLRSGVFVDRPPFNLRARMVGDIDYAPREVLRTWVLGSAPMGN